MPAKREFNERKVGVQNKLPKVDTIAAIKAPTGGLKKVAMTWDVVLCANSLGIF
jgi:hypothetical protein